MTRDLKKGMMREHIKMLKNILLDYEQGTERFVD